MANNNREMPKATEPLYFVVDEKMNSADLTDKGTPHLTQDDELKKVNEQLHSFDLIDEQIYLAHATSAIMSIIALAVLIVRKRWLVIAHAF